MNKQYTDSTHNTGAHGGGLMNKQYIEPAQSTGKAVIEVMEYTKTYLIIDCMVQAGEKGITQWDAIRIARHTRLSGLIYDLRAEGITIHSREEIGKDGTRYTRYWLGDDVDTEKLLNSKRKKRKKKRLMN